MQTYHNALLSQEKRLTPLVHLHVRVGILHQTFGSILVVMDGGARVTTVRVD